MAGAGGRRNGVEWRDFEFMGLSKASIFFFCFVRKRSVCLIVSIVGVVNMFVMFTSTSFLAECRIKERTERENVGCFTSLLFILSCIHAIIHSLFPSSEPHGTGENRKLIRMTRKPYV